MKSNTGIPKESGHGLEFSPCSDNCPALTGQPFGSVKYCPMIENDRHKFLALSLSVGYFPEGALDLRFRDAKGKRPYYDHEDYTDCCLNFQCCCNPETSPLDRVVVLQEIPDRTCEECGKQDECRPYGKDGKWVCFECGMKDEETAKRAFLAQFLSL